MNAANGTVAGQWQYGPFGEVIRQTGPMARANLYRFSTKYQDDETGLLYYGYRYYDPSTGRWPSRDPIEEDGGLNVYNMLGNDVQNKYDLLGQKWVIERDGKRLAMASCNEDNDTFDGLAIMAGLDAVDYKRWAHTKDAKPVKCKQYKVPNAVYIDIGKLGWLESIY